jgi:hypothetical protein
MSTTAAPALEELARVATLRTSDDDLREFRDPFAHSTWEDYIASAVVMPETVEQVEQLLREDQHVAHGASRRSVVDQVRALDLRPRLDARRPLAGLGRRGQARDGEDGGDSHEALLSVGRRSGCP